MGTIYERGLGVEKNKKEAIKWYQIAARNGSSNSKEKLKDNGLSW